METATKWRAVLVSGASLSGSTYAMNLHTKQLSTRCKCMVEEDFVRFE